MVKVGLCRRDYGVRRSTAAVLRGGGGREGVSMAGVCIEERRSLSLGKPGLMCGVRGGGGGVERSERANEYHLSVTARCRRRQQQR